MSLEWWNDMGMSSKDWKFLWQRFWSPSSLGHPCHFESMWNDYFVILWSFKYWMTSEWRRWCWNDNFLILGWWLMTWMRVEWGNFWSKANALDFFLQHFALIWTIFYHLTLIALKNLAICAVSLGKMTLNDIRMSIHSKNLEHVLLIRINDFEWYKNEHSLKKLRTCAVSLG